jgi:lysophospholipase L1-like esterase
VSRAKKQTKTKSRRSSAVRRARGGSAASERTNAPGSFGIAPPDQTREALERLALAALVFTALSLLTLALPAGLSWRGMELDRLKPWMPGDAIPIVGLFAREADAPSVAGAGGSFRAPEQVRRDIEESLGAAVAQNLGETAGVSRDATPTPSGEADQSPAIHIEPTEYEGIDVEIEHPEALRAFFEALKRTAEREDAALTRIGHYGDSSIASDLITYTVRRSFQRRFGDGGHGFHLIARGAMPYTHRDVMHRASTTWETRQIVAEQDRSGLYGYGGVAFRPDSGAFASFGTDDRGPVGNQVSRFEIYYRKQPRGGRVRYRIDGGEYVMLDTAGESGDGFEVIDVEDGAHRLELRAAGGGPVSLYGVVMEREGPGVVYDSMGLVGARARRLLNYDGDHLRAQMEHRDLDLLVLGFGGNEADDPLRPIELHYEEEFVRVIRTMRAGRRDMSCLIFAPLDQAARDERGNVTTMRTIPTIVEAQRNAARREGCAFFDTFAAMGGEGSMGRWTRSRPRLALSDYRHATPAGYEVIGNMFYKALLKAFAENL